MISIVVCSANPSLFRQFEQNVQETIGVPFEMVPIDNSNKQYNICSAYNKGKAACKYDIICFVHEDILFETKNWGKVLVKIFEDPDVGLAGIFGACYLGLFPEPVADLDECQGQVIEGTKTEKRVRKANRFPGSRLTEVAVVDGVFMASRKKIMSTLFFSEDILNGFHGYDLDLSMQIRQRYKVVVSHDILLLHLSSGTYDASYYEALKILTDKWDKYLPAYTAGYSKNEITELKLKSCRKAVARKTMKDTLSAIRYAAKQGVLFTWLREKAKNTIRPRHKHAEPSPFDQLVGELNKYFSQHPAEKKQFEKELQFLNSPIVPLPGIDKLMYAVLPYPFVLQLDYRRVEVFRDEEAGMFYVYLDGKKLYYHQGFTNAADVAKNFTFVCAEQHPDSPHNYLDKFFSINHQDVVADLGAAEGNFSLLIVDKVKELIIVEADPVWLPALEKTFEPWKEKVQIISKFAGDCNDEHSITLDQLPTKNKLSAVKMDIEGAEVSVLQTAADFIRENNIRMAVTTYHSQTDATDIQEILKNNNYETVFSKGYMLFVNDRLSPPYFRHGLIKAKKN